ncbi:hypothetical protein [Corallococcus sp. 4LFB]|uniref:hypothetical protein n=1 Tax=Corallococcus sp. 4LFB TaxID=3383249 RepID=UPI003976E7BB
MSEKIIKKLVVKRDVIEQLPAPIASGTDRIVGVYPKISTGINFDMVNDGQ